MDLSTRGYAALQTVEGFRPHCYADSAGVLTIGYGHTANAGAPKPYLGLTISHDEAVHILHLDADQFIVRVLMQLGSAPQNVIDGAVLFDFNTGAIDRASWPALYREGKLHDAEAHLLLWNRVRTGKSIGLEHRREIEANMIFRGLYPSG